MGAAVAPVVGSVVGSADARMAQALEIKVGEPVIVQQQRVEVSPDAATQIESVQLALERFDAVATTSCPSVSS